MKKATRTDIRELEMLGNSKVIKSRRQENLNQRNLGKYDKAMN